MLFQEGDAVSLAGVVLVVREGKAGHSVGSVDVPSDDRFPLEGPVAAFVHRDIPSQVPDYVERVGKRMLDQLVPIGGDNPVHLDFLASERDKFGDHVVKPRIHVHHQAFHIGCPPIGTIHEKEGL